MAVNVVVTATGPLFSREEAKLHLRVDHDDDDVIIDVYSDAAVARVLQYCGRDLVPEGSVPEAAFKVAALLVLGDLYANRDTTTLARPVMALIDAYRWIKV